MVMATFFSSRIQALWSFQAAVAMHVGEMAKAPWFDPSLGRLDNKSRMKELGGFLFLSKELLREFLILGMAKAFEDFVGEAADLGLPRFDLWQGDALALPYHHEVRCIRNLANVIKHNGSRIVDGGGPACASLIQAGFPSGAAISDLDFDIERALYQSYVFLDALTGHLTRVVVRKREDPATDFELFKTREPWFIKR